MSYPESPSLSTSYTAKEQALGNGSFPGQELDVDLEAIRASFVELLTFVKGVTRSDGKLANGSVGPETLGPGITLGFEPPTTWETATAYTPGQTVFETNAFYICLLQHESTTFAADLASGRWDLLVDYTQISADAVSAANAAAASEGVATTKAAEAAASEGVATTKAAEAAASASTASTKAGEAAASEGVATTKAAEAAASEGVATTKAAEAAASADAAATFDPSNYLRRANNLSDLINAEAARTNLGLGIGSQVQAFNQKLASLAGLSLQSGDLLYATGANTFGRLAADDGKFVAFSGSVPAAVRSPGLTPHPNNPILSSGQTDLVWDNIPTGVTIIRVHFNSLSSSGTDNGGIQLGDSVGWQTSGYSGGLMSINTPFGSPTDRFLIDLGGATRVNDGHWEIVHQGGNLWAGNTDQSNLNGGIISGETHVTLSGELTRVRITVLTNTYDLGNGLLFYA